MTVWVLLALGAALYAGGRLRVARAGRHFPRFAPFAFALGLAAIAAVSVEPVDRLAEASLAWHMLQHLVLLAVAPPLLLFGAPLRLALAALPAPLARALARVLRSAPMRVADRPVFGLLVLTGALYGIHFSPLYELALEHPAAHALEHSAFLFAGFLYWSPIFAVAPAPHAAPHPERILVLLLTLPVSAFLGFAFYTAGHVLYAHYAAMPSALTDQMNAGEVMWLSAGAPLVLALLWCVADWGKLERRLGAAYDATAAIEEAA